MILKNARKQVFLLTVLTTIFCDILATKTFNPESLPTIVWWTDLLYPHAGKSSQIQCSLGKCMSSARRRKYRNDKITIAYLFYGTDFYGDDLPLPRRDNHIWSLLHEESPMNNYILSHSPGIQLFNYTGTFSRNSDFPLTTQNVPSLEYLAERRPMPIQEKNEHRRNGTAPVLYLQSHCNVASDRDHYVKELMNSIDVDSYGVCLHNKDLPPHLVTTDTHNDEELFTFISKYKFHLAFENAICDDYITEKLFRVFHVGCVPVYRGSPTVRDWVPSDTSVVVADDFEHPAQLADFLLKLDQNDALYEKYLSYKNDGISNELLKNNILERTWGVNDERQMDFIRGFECYVCDQIQRENKVSVPPFIASRKHMNCHQPRLSLASNDETLIRAEKTNYCSTRLSPADEKPPAHNYMNGHQADASPSSKEQAPSQDIWLLEDWIESYFFAYDQARAIELMIKSKENDSSKFMEYITKLKYPN